MFSAEQMEVAEAITKRINASSVLTFAAETVGLRIEHRNQAYLFPACRCWIDAHRFAVVFVTAATTYKRFSPGDRLRLSPADQPSAIREKCIVVESKPGDKKFDEAERIVLILKQDQ